MSVPSWRSIVFVSTSGVNILVARLPSGTSKSTSESRSFVLPWIGPWVSYAGSINRTPKSCGSLTASPVLARRFAPCQRFTRPLSIPKRSRSRPTV